MKLSDILRLAARSRRAQDRLAAALAEREAELAAAAAALRAAIDLREARARARESGGTVLYAGLLSGPRSATDLAAVQARLAELAAAVTEADAGIAAADEAVRSAIGLRDTARRELRGATRDTEKWDLAAADRRQDDRRAAARRAQARTDGQSALRSAIAMSVGRP